jgi:hypothetical protein
VYQLSERLADEIWNVVDMWDEFAKALGQISPKGAAVEASKITAVSSKWRAVRRTRQSIG